MGKYKKEIEFVDAEREQLYAKVSIMGASGAGKTVSALKLAYGLTDGDWSKVYVGDTENKRALAYRGTTHTGLEIGKFKHVPLKAPYDTEKFMDLIEVAYEKGAGVLIIDSISHQWEGLGGVLEENEQLGSDFWAWKGPKKKHHKLKDYIQQVPMHIIVTMRTKQEYAVIPGGGKNGKNGIEKLGMKPVQENAFDYEFLLSFHINEDSEANTTKDNTGLFRGEEFQMEVDHGQKLRAWLVEGKEVKTVQEDKNEAEEKRQKLIAYFTEQRGKTPKAQSWYTQKEIAADMKIPEWPLEVLEKLYNDLKEAAEKRKQKQAPAPKPEEPKQEEKETGTAPEPADEHTPGSGKLDRAMVTSQIVKMRFAPEVDKMIQEFLGKSKVSDLTQLNDTQLLFALTLAERRTKTLEEGVLV